MSTIRWGIVGVGNVCEVKSGPGFQKAAGSALVAVMRRDGAAAADFARRHGVPRWYDDADRLIADPEVDAVYIATPPGSHCELALRVCAAGKPCYVEKPMARSHAECLRMVEAFAARDLPLFVAYYRRGLPRFVGARELVRGGAIGRLTSVSYRLTQGRHLRADPSKLPWRVQVGLSGGGDFLDLGSHTLDIIAFIAGDLTGVEGDAANRATPMAVEDVVSLRFTAGGVPGTGLWNFAGIGEEDLIEFTGTDGRLSLSTFGDEPLRLLRRGGHEERISLPNPPHVQQPLIQTMVDQLRGLGTCPSTGASAARTSWAMDRALERYYGGREDAFWERPGTWPRNRRPA